MKLANPNISSATEPSVKDRHLVIKSRKVRSRTLTRWNLRVEE